MQRRGASVGWPRSAGGGALDDAEASFSEALRLWEKAYGPGELQVGQVRADLGLPRSVLVYIDYPTSFDSTNTQRALEGSDISVPPLPF